MPAYKIGSKGYKKQQEKRKATLLKKYGSEEKVKEYYAEIGRKGGTNNKSIRFFAIGDNASKWGSVGGFMKGIKAKS